MDAVPAGVRRPVKSSRLVVHPRSLTRGREKFGPSAVSRPKAPDFRSAPLTPSSERPPVGANASRPALAKLLGSPLGMALGTEAADVAVPVRTAMGQGYNVIRYGRLADDPVGGTITTEWFCP